jgi:hypothetical protein
LPEPAKPCQTLPKRAKTTSLEVWRIEPTASPHWQFANDKSHPPILRVSSDAFVDQPDSTHYHPPQRSF